MEGASHGTFSGHGGGTSKGPGESVSPVGSCGIFEGENAKLLCP